MVRVACRPSIFAPSPRPPQVADAAQRLRGLAPLRAAVQANAREQVAGLASALHSVLPTATQPALAALRAGGGAGGGDAGREAAAELSPEAAAALAMLARAREAGALPPAAAHAGRVSGLAMALGSGPSPDRPPPPAQEEEASGGSGRGGEGRGEGGGEGEPKGEGRAGEAVALLRARAGFSLALAPSGAGGGAGLGLFLRGRAAVGAVVAFYPGLGYPPHLYHTLPGLKAAGAAYDNPYLMGRYDNTVLDARPWGRGFLAAPGGVGAGGGTDGAGCAAAADVKAAAEEEEASAAALERLRAAGVELRNPLALAHFANHPPRGVAPNVVACPFDLSQEDEEAGGPPLDAAGAPGGKRGPPRLPLRPTVPNAPCDPGDQGNWVSRAVNPAHFVARAGWPVRSLLLVAARPLSDGEELFLNYRLNPDRPRPAWYAPVDEDEDRRRWG